VDDSVDVLQNWTNREHHDVRQREGNRGVPKWDGEVPRVGQDQARTAVVLADLPRSIPTAWRHLRLQEERGKAEGVAGIL
jgi:hypothetical protein